MDACTKTIIWNKAAMAGGGSAPGPGDNEPSDDLLEELDASYSALIPRDQVIGDQLEVLRQQRPDDFAPAS